MYCRFWLRCFYVSEQLHDDADVAANDDDARRKMWYFYKRSFLKQTLDE